jgi:hypothetical protein
MSPALTSPSMVASSKPCELAGKAAHQRVTQLRSMQALRRFRKTCCLSHGLSARERMMCRRRAAACQAMISGGDNGWGSCRRGS